MLAAAEYRGPDVTAGNHGYVTVTPSSGSARSGSAVTAPQSASQPRTRPESRYEHCHVC